MKRHPRHSPTHAKQPFLTHAAQRAFMASVNTGAELDHVTQPCLNRRIKIMKIKSLIAFIVSVFLANALFGAAITSSVDQTTFNNTITSSIWYYQLQPGGPEDVTLRLQSPSGHWLWRHFFEIGSCHARNHRRLRHGYN
jgi:hypothetical protein